jgi:hypothetical protein
MQKPTYYSAKHIWNPIFNRFKKPGGTLKGCACFI